MSTVMYNGAAAAGVIQDVTEIDWARRALIDKYVTKRDELSPEVRAQVDEARRYTAEKVERGKVLESWSKENFPIGLDKNMEPFPLTGPDQEPASAAKSTSSREAFSEDREHAEEKQGEPNSRGIVTR